MARLVSATWKLLSPILFGDLMTTKILSSQISYTVMNVQERMLPKPTSVLWDGLQVQPLKRNRECAPHPGAAAATKIVQRLRALQMEVHGVVLIPTQIRSHATTRVKTFVLQGGPKVVSLRTTSDSVQPVGALDVNKTVQRRNVCRLAGNGRDWTHAATLSLAMLLRFAQQAGLRVTSKSR